MDKNATAAIRADNAETAPGSGNIHDETIGHGNSPAAWTCVLVMLVGAAISSIAFILANTWLFWGGILVMVIGLVVGYVMMKAGYGVNGSKLKNPGH